MRARSAGATPGPWARAEIGRWVEAADGEISICEVHGFNGRDGGDEPDNDANAALIAAAPDLRDALTNLLASLSGQPKACGHEFTCVCPGDAARAALAKAEGPARGAP